MSNDLVAVVTGPEAPELDRFAASELCAYLEKLFGLRVHPTTSIPATARDVFLIGNPATNPLLDTNSFPAVSDQGIAIKSQPGARSTLVVGGGSPTATLWAVYDLVGQWGVRYLLHGDVLPARTRFRMPAHNLKQEPILPVRQWRVVNEHAMGPVSWGMADYRPVLDQLAKLKFNRLLISLWPEQPFLPFEYKGVKYAGGTLFFGGRFPITDNMVGRSLYGAEKEFWNPDLPLPGGDPAELNRAAIQHIRSLMAYARQRGMRCVMPVTLTEFPLVFKPLLKDTRQGHMDGAHTFGLGANADADDPVLVGLARAVVEATLKTYPEVDYLELGVAEQREWARQYERAWNALDGKRGISQVRSLNAILQAAQQRKDYPGGSERAVSEVKADILALYFFDEVIADPQIQRLVQGAGKKIIVSVAEELYPVLGRLFPAGCETLNFVDYTPARIVKRREVLKSVPAREVPSVLIYTLHDDNVGVLPELATHSLHELTRDIRDLGWAGFSTRYWLTGDHDPCLAYLSRAAWDARATPEAAYRDQITHVCGAAAVPDLLKVFSEVEAATTTLEWHGLGLTFTDPHMITQHWSPRPLPAELKSVVTAYQAALNAARQALGKTQAGGESYVRYWIGRLEFGIAYMQAIEAVRAAAAANGAKDPAIAIREATRALDLIKRGLNAYAGVVRDRSDKGAIAVMNEYVVRALEAKIETLKQTRPAANPAVRAADFHSRRIYQSRQSPGYTSWVSFFPGERGQWYLTCEEVTRAEHPLPGSSPQQLYEMGMPRGYDKSKYQMEIVILESTDALDTWKEISRQPVLFQHSAGSFGQARTRDGRFLRFTWGCYSLDPSVAPNEVLYESGDNGTTWKRMPPFHNARFASWPHRLRTLRDGTLVLCVPLRPRWGKETDYPTRTASRLDVVADMQMNLFISHDQGRAWSGPLPILPGQNVSETDFVELPGGDLLFINNSIFANPGRQFVYRDGNRFSPGPLERVHSGTVPETVCLTEDGVLVGCMRAGNYYWSDDLGQNWQRLEGVQGKGEVYQPWIQYLGGGKIACAGHYGLDDPIGKRSQYVNLQTFKIQVLRKTVAAKLWVERDYDDTTRSYSNSYTFSLSAGGVPLAEKDIQVWHVARDQPGYDGRNKYPLEERMKMGGKSVKVRTDAAGKAKLRLPEYNGITNIHSSYQLLVRFNPDGQYPEYKPAQLPQLEFYANSGLDQ